MDALVEHHPAVVASLQAYGGAITDVPDERRASAEPRDPVGGRGVPGQGDRRHRPSDLHEDRAGLEKTEPATAQILGEHAGLTVRLPVVEDSVVMGDRTRLRQLFLNLVTNASDATTRRVRLGEMVEGSNWRLVQLEPGGVTGLRRAAAEGGRAGRRDRKRRGRRREAGARGIRVPRAPRRACQN